VIIYGYRTSNQVMGQLPQLCQRCQRQGMQTVVRSRRMFTLFWIPLFPISKKTVMRCSLCGNQMQIDNAQADSYFAQQGIPPTGYR
jgi:hypothetical protein